MNIIFYCTQRQSVSCSRQKLNNNYMDRHDIHSLQRMNCTYIDYPLTSTPAPAEGWHLLFIWMKFLNMLDVLPWIFSLQTFWVSIGWIVLTLIILWLLLHHKQKVWHLLFIWVEISEHLGCIAGEIWCRCSRLPQDELSALWWCLNFSSSLVPSLKSKF